MFPLLTRARLMLILAIAASASTNGCSTNEAEFRQNLVYVKAQEKTLKSEINPRQLQDVDNVLVAFFGTPDDPRVPQVGDETADLLSQSRLEMAAGAVSSNEQGNPQGLYREHCAHCHGVTGDGAGPTAEFLNPYPRDYRMGVFKFKSTPKGENPTHEDLRQILVNGIPGTAMPSFKLLPEDELESLIQYVQYLAIRGEVERALIYECANELDRDDRLVDFDAAETDRETYNEQVEYVTSIVADTMQRWVDAESKAVPVPARPEPADLAASIAHGRELFYGPIANCVKCHGDSALGDGQKNDFDDWTKDWTVKIGIDPNKAESGEEIEHFIAAGAFEPRNIHPRNLRQGVYRGGRRPLDLYWRVKNGIDGTPMPGVLMKPEGAGPDAQGLSPADLWDLINYVRQLPYEELSETGLRKPNFQRDRL
ncbi:MAG: c-type cytochrome [Planctomycetales bacterium]|nr:c-type cytochrome [Planctomycetales bacterium]